MLRDILIYLPMFVSLLWSLVLLSSLPKYNKAKFLLGIFMFVCFLLFLSYAFYYKNQIEVFIYFDILFIFTSLSVFPLNYCYIKFLTVETEFRLRNIRLFIPAMAIGVISIINYIIMTPEQRTFYVTECIFNNRFIWDTDFIVVFQKSISKLIPIMYVIQILYTFFKSKKYLQEFNTRIADFYSNIQDKTINWAGHILNSVIISLVVSVLFTILGRKFFMDSEYTIAIPSIAFSTILFIAGNLGNAQNFTISNFENDIQKNDIDKSQNEPIIELATNTHVSKKLRKELLNLFEKKHIYTNPDLQISDIATMLHTNRTYISQAINQEFSCTFSAFVNTYRINKSKELLETDIEKKQSLEQISQQVGFGSLHSFIRVFKEQEGCTPGNYRESTLSTNSNVI